MHLLRGTPLVAILLGAGACASGTGAAAPAPAPSLALLPGARPESFHARDSALVGEYDANGAVLFIVEQSGKLWLLDTAKATAKFAQVTASEVGRLGMRRRDVGPRGGATQLQITPARDVAEVRREALAATPPVEPPPAKAADLVELTALDPTIRLEIRYATTNNFLGTKIYEESRAFLQRPAAEAVVRANQKLRALGYGLLIHDAYRPWYVTKIFWDATPVDKHWLVANPAQGSKHNRGAAVDLTLFELASGQAVDMPSTYDETTGRASATYPGGTSLQRWNRALLRNAMVSEGFVVNPTEWWHFDYGNWRDYAIGNVPFDRIGR